MLSVKCKVIRYTAVMTVKILVLLQGAHACNNSTLKLRQLEDPISFHFFCLFVCLFVCLFLSFQAAVTIYVPYDGIVK